MGFHFDGGKNNPGLKDLASSLASTPMDAQHIPSILFNALHQAGWIGVDLFFVLSGFLVSGLLFREHKQSGKVSLGRFLIRRGFKIYPPFYIFLLSTVVAIFLLKSRDLNTNAIVCESFFVQNYGPNLWGHTWSLAVEEHFYFLLALVVFLLLRIRQSNPFKILISLFVFVAITALALRIVTSIIHPEFAFKRHLTPTHLRIDSLLFGVVISYFYHFEPSKVAVLQRHRRWVMAISLLLIMPAFLIGQDHIIMRTIGLTGLYVGFGGLLLISLSVTASQNVFLRRSSSAIAGIGRHSYSIYLWHIPVLIMGVPLLARIVGRPMGAWIELCIYGAGSILVGILMAKIVEFPALKLRDHLFPSLSVAKSEAPTEPLQSSHDKAQQAALTA